MVGEQVWNAAVAEIRSLLCQGGQPNSKFFQPNRLQPHPRRTSTRINFPCRVPAFLTANSEAAGKLADIFQNDSSVLFLSGIPESVPDSFKTILLYNTTNAETPKVTGLHPALSV